MNPRRTFLASIVGVAVAATRAAADKLLVRPRPGSGRPPYVIDTETGRKLYDIDGEYVEDGQPDPPNPPGPNPPDPDPPGDNLTAQIRAAARQHINSKAEAEKLIAVLDQLAGILERVPKSADDIVDMLDAVIPMIEARLGTKGRLKKLSDAVLNLGTPSAALLRTAIAAVAAEFEVDVKKLTQSVASAQQMMHDNDTSLVAASRAATDTPQEAIDLAEILQIIQMIIQFLTALGWI